MWEVLVGQTLIEWNFIGAHKIRCDLFKSHLILGLSLVHKWPPTVKVLGLARIHIPHAPKLPTSLVIFLTDSHSSLIPLSLSHSLAHLHLCQSLITLSPATLLLSPSLSFSSPSLPCASHPHLFSLPCARPLSLSVSHSLAHLSPTTLRLSRHLHQPLSADPPLLSPSLQVSRSNPSHAILYSQFDWNSYPFESPQISIPSRLSLGFQAERLGFVILEGHTDRTSAMNSEAERGDRDFDLD